jgi:uncharacterized protein (TIGR00369 family)
MKDLNTNFTAPAGFEDRVRASFAKQGAMALIGAQLMRVSAGEVEIHLPFNPNQSQQHGFLHAGILTTALDSACGFATFSLFPANAGILTIEFKVNLLSPGDGELFRMIGKVRKAGRTISLAEGEAYALKHGREKLIATMTATTMTIADRQGIVG